MTKPIVVYVHVHMFAATHKTIQTYIFITALACKFLLLKFDTRL